MQTPQRFYKSLQYHIISLFMYQSYMTQSLTYLFPLLCQFWDGIFSSFHHRAILCFSKVHFIPLSFYKKLNTSICFHKPKEIQRGFSLKRHENSLQYSLCSKPLQLKEAEAQQAGRAAPPAPASGTKLSILASSQQIFETYW